MDDGAWASGKYMHDYLVDLESYINQSYSGLPGLLAIASHPYKDVVSAGGDSGQDSYNLFTDVNNAELGNK